MKRLLAILTLFGALTLAGAQSYSVPWHTIDAGGGTSTGGVYKVRGTVGQPDAGVMSGGNYSVSGGFWGLIQTPGAPALGLYQTSTNTLMVYWPGPAIGFILQQNLSLATTNWSNVPVTVNEEGVTRYVIVPAPIGSRFYRLVKP